MKVKLIRAYGYDTARLYISDARVVRDGSVSLPTDQVPREFVTELERELTKQAGWPHMDNKVLFIYEYDGKKWAAKFHDLTATFVSWHQSPDMEEGWLPANVHIFSGNASL